MTVSLQSCCGQPEIKHVIQPPLGSTETEERTVVYPEGGEVDLSSEEERLHKEEFTISEEGRPSVDEIDDGGDIWDKELFFLFFSDIFFLLY